ncbi:MAG TPA: SGNH/GDSL hydrolase family protein [Terracidiphilus sp.]|nr:SGNH/GDSL hydrolase family protein [Terracidiphilus sp.]
MKIGLMLSLVYFVAFPPQGLTQIVVNPPLLGRPAVPPSIVFPNPGQQFVGAPISVPAHATSGPPVTISSQTRSVCTVSGQTVSFLAEGICTLTASQSAADFDVAAPVSQSFNVDPMYMTNAMLSHSLLAPGDPSRLQRLIRKARAGEPVTIACIGGSITEGLTATDPGHRYMGRLASWWPTVFPRSSVTIVNAGVGATGSTYGALRLQRDVLSTNPDLIIVEFAVNDPAKNPGIYQDTYEGLVRQILDSPQHPAVILLFMTKFALPMDEATLTAQGWQSPIGANYNVPMVSFFDAIAPELTDGTIALSDITSDDAHPNNLGHAYVGLFLANVIQNVIDEYPDGVSPSPIPPTANPMYSTDFEFTTLQDGTGGEGMPLDPVSNQGWTALPTGTDPVFGYAPGGLQSSTPGSTLDFVVAGDQILIGDLNYGGPVGQISVSVDGQPATIIDSFYQEQPGVWWRRLAPVLQNGAKTTHSVHIVLLSTHAAGSTGTTFRILCIGTGGAQAQ